ncbi:MAG: bifunctional hydroxymethylpyrimidine kinase/phosphomethylpyrimidine kinase [Ruminococcaceae bacterium]|nr:bifunctional hydroxymethylpyrimidine kinase/phosphomethylpyrimidine kinase [Oscillospiraceae bacterium]
MKTVLTIAGSDSSGGAGIQADIKTMTMNGVYAMSAVTALTAQNTTGVTAVMEVSPDFLKQQLDCVFDDIRPDAVKIGMLASPALVRMTADCLRHYEAENVVIDPVMVATSGSSLLKPEAVRTLMEALIPAAVLVTPNIPEAQVLAEMRIENRRDMQAAAVKICTACGCAVLLKGGHAADGVGDLLVTPDGCTEWFEGIRIDTRNTHGTGCTLSSAIAANLAKGFELAEAIKLAKEYVTDALAAMLDLGKGSGPLQHNFSLTGKYAQEKSLPTERKA